MANNSWMEDDDQADVRRTRTGRLLKLPARFLDSVLPAPPTKRRKVNDVTNNDVTTNDVTTQERSPRPGPSRPRPESPVPGTSQPSPTPGPSESPEPEDSGSEDDQGNSIFQTATKVFENNNLEIYISKTSFKRQKKFALDDHLYSVVVRLKANAKELPLLKDFILILDQTLVKILRDLQAFYDSNEEHLVYIAIKQTGMISGVRSPAMDLKSNAAAIIQHVMNSFNQFINSNENLHLDKSFQVYIKVLSHNNVMAGSGRRKAPIRVKLGSSVNSKNDLKLAGCILLSEYMENHFKNDCLLVSFLLAYYNLLEPKKFNYFKPLWNPEKFSLLRRKNAIKQFQSDLVTLKNELTLSEQGPYEINTLEVIAAKYNCQVNVIKNSQERFSSFESFPDIVNFELPQIFLLRLENTHVCPIINIEKFYNKSKRKLCLLCKKSFNNYWKHTCSSKNTCCPQCFLPYLQENFYEYKIKNYWPYKFCPSKVEPILQNPITCNKCNCKFTNASCFQAHLVQVCQNNQYFCTTCKKISVRSFHICNEYQKLFCKHCEVTYERNTQHYCSIKPQLGSKSWPKLGFFNFIFVNGIPISCSVMFEKHPNQFSRDFFSNDVIQDKSNSDFCFNYDALNKRPKQSGKQPQRSQETNFLRHTLTQKEKKSCIEKFMLFLLNPECHSSVFLSLNEMNQNMALVLEMLTKYFFTPSLVKKDNSFILMKLASLNISFLNVSNFFNLSPNDLASQFQFSGEILFFPKFLNNQELSVDSFIEWSDSESLVLKKKDFWQKVSSNWKFCDQLKAYTFQQTEIVAHACLHFLSETFSFQQKLLAHLKRSSDDLLFPFTVNTPTISSYSYSLLFYLYLNDEHLISSPNENIYLPNHVSKGELEFVMYMERKYPNLIHAFNSSSNQYRFGRFDVDAYDPVSQRIFQYQGCYTHLHLFPECTNSKRAHLTKETAVIYKKSGAHTYEMELKRQEAFKKYIKEHHSHEVKDIILMEECLWQNIRKVEHVKKFLQANQNLINRPRHRLCPSIAARGGINETFKFHWSKSESPNKKLMFADINSLYPFICTQNTFPVGEPRVIVGKELKNISIVNKRLMYKDICLENGLIMCEFVVPSDLEFPFLQYRVNNEFVFMGNCRTCCELQRPVCNHRSNKSKSFISTYTLAEINKALSLNYELLNIFEVIYFPESKFILKEYFEAVLALRLSVSKPNFTSDVDAESYCNTINTFLNLPQSLELKPENLSHNEMQKMFFKLKSNACLGRFSSKQQLETCEVINDPKRLNDLLSQTSVTEIHALNDDSILVSYPKMFKNKRDRSNIFIGSLIPALGRIYLYEKIELLRSQNISVLAADTDSIIYELEEGQADPLKFSFLPGDFKNVLPNCTILSYNSLGPRNYSILYKDENGILKSVIKCKGLCLTSHQLSNELTPDIYEQFVNSYFEKERNEIRFTQFRKATLKPFYKKELKLSHYTFKNELYVKRYSVNATTTVPFGYKK